MDKTIQQEQHLGKKLSRRRILHGLDEKNMKLKKRKWRKFFRLRTIMSMISKKKNDTTPLYFYEENTRFMDVLDL